MTATEILIMCAELLGGLAFFLYGMNTMSGGLEQMAGGALERTLKKVTSNDGLGFLLGAGITIAIQSSSAMTVMLVGLVNSGILNFADTFGMIMGSNVGTTFTAWILTLGGINGDNFFLTILNPSTFAPILAFCGIVMRMLCKKERQRNFGMILIGFAILMAGMDMMSGSMDTFRENEAFQGLLTAFSSPIIAFLVATLFTGVIQSSAATIAIIQVLALSAFGTDNPVTYQMAIPLVLGANIGTCVTAFLSSIGTNRDAKRVVVMHAYANAIGGALCIAVMYILMMVSPTFMLRPVNMIGVAAIHSLFNLGITVLFAPLKKVLIRLCECTVRSSEEKTHTVFLDERLFNNTPLAISECRRLTVEMAEYAREALMNSLDLVCHYDEAKADHVVKLEALTDKYEDKLGTYLVRLSGNETGDADSHTLARMLHSIGDFERIADHALNIRDVALEMRDKKIEFSGEAKKELPVVIRAVIEILNIAVDSFIHDDAEAASCVEPLEEVIDKLTDEIRAHHVDRLQRGECTIQLGFVFSDLVTNCERVSDHCSNIAVYTLQSNSNKLDTHKYLHKVKSAVSGDYVDKYNAYEAKYSFDAPEHEPPAASETN